MSKKLKREMLTRAQARPDAGLWTKHTDWHWQRRWGNEIVNFWPTTHGYNINGKRVSEKVAKDFIQHMDSRDFIKEEVPFPTGE